MVVLPAILVLLGHRVNALTLWRRSVTPPEEGSGTGSPRSSCAARSPSPPRSPAAGARCTFLGLRLTQPDDRVLPPGAEGREVGDVIRDEFESEEAGALSVVTEDAADGPLSAADTEAYAVDLALLPGVSRVDAATGTYCGQGAADQLGCQPGLPRARHLRPLRGLHPRPRAATCRWCPPSSPSRPRARTWSRPWRHPVARSRARDRASAGLVDVNDSLFSRLPWALGLIAVITAVVLFLMFGSVVIPLKAIVMNLLSLTATFGALVWIFQDGHLSGVLDFTATVVWQPPCRSSCSASRFGLSMDYEVFLLSRIKEEHDAGADNETSVATGLQHTGRIVTAAAVLMAVIFLSFATGHVSFIKMFGIGLTLVVLIDAFLIRGTSCRRSCAWRASGTAGARPAAPHPRPVGHQRDRGLRRRRGRPRPRRRRPPERAARDPGDVTGELTRR